MWRVVLNSLILNKTQKLESSRPWCNIPWSVVKFWISMSSAISSRGKFVAWDNMPTGATKVCDATFLTGTICWLTSSKCQQNAWSSPQAIRTFRDEQGAAWRWWPFTGELFGILAGQGNYQSKQFRLTSTEDRSTFRQSEWGRIRSQHHGHLSLAQMRCLGSCLQAQGDCASCAYYRQIGINENAHTAREMVSLFRAIIPASHCHKIATVPCTPAVLHHFSITVCIGGKWHPGTGDALVLSNACWMQPCHKCICKTRNRTNSHILPICLANFDEWLIVMSQSL